MTDTSILHYFTRVGFMDDGHVTGGMTYLDWQHSFSKASGAKTMRFGDKSSGSEVEEKSAKYAKLMSLIDKRDEKRIAEALHIREVPSAVISTLWDLRHVYLASFSRLGLLIIEVNKHFPCRDNKKSIS